MGNTLVKRQSVVKVDKVSVWKTYSNSKARVYIEASYDRSTGKIVSRGGFDNSVLAELLYEIICMPNGDKLKVCPWCHDYVLMDASDENSCRGNCEKEIENESYDEADEI